MDYKDTESSIQFLITDETGVEIIGASLTAYYGSNEVAMGRVSDIDGIVYIPKTQFKKSVHWIISYTGFKDLIIEEDLSSKFVHIKLGEKLIGLDELGVTYIEGQTWVGKISENKIELPFRDSRYKDMWECYQKIDP